MAELPPAGFYADPHDATFERWWDGEAWSEHRRPVGPPGDAYRADSLHSTATNSALMGARADREQGSPAFAQVCLVLLGVLAFVAVLRYVARLGFGWDV
ncbi:hypothetical protein GCM10022215_23840 [Nocardioides fonticola]|uniref:DUF2510 domain-containing protein n=1 Tax=Nocardioides fonticola TaxID=450363 RepID=A0ABP7XJM3_9ACTN